MLSGFFSGVKILNSEPENSRISFGMFHKKDEKEKGREERRKEGER